MTSATSPRPKVARVSLIGSGATCVRASHPWAALFTLAFLVAQSLTAQAPSDTLTGIVSDTAHRAIPHATVSLRNTGTGTLLEAHADSAGVYLLHDLAPGTYEVSAVAPGYTTSTKSVTITSGVRETLDLELSRGLSLSDLGFTGAQTQGSVTEQARLDKRSHMLRTHQQLGLITTVPMIATIFTGLFAGGQHITSADRDVHAALGITTTGLYLSTAYFAAFAPKIPGTATRGQIRLHKALAWIHGPGMILTPVLGAMAFTDKAEGRRVEGLASAHGAVAIVTASAYGAAILSVSLKF